MKKIAVITGASGGIGREFVRTADKFGRALDEVWVISRRIEKLNNLECPYKVRSMPMDLTDRSSFREYKNMLSREPVTVSLLVNASGFAKFDAVMDVSLEVNLNMVDLNVQALQAMCQITIPYMEQGSKIINIASVAAFQPIPYINVYAATKAFVLSYSRALNRELKKQGISVLALCPFWTKTKFFDRAISKTPIVKKYIAMYDAKDIVERAWRDLHRGKDVAQYGFIARSQALLCKILPHRLIMDIWLNQQGLN